MTAAGSHAAAPLQPPVRRRRGRRSSVRGWRAGDRVLYVLIWLAGAGLCLLAGSIVVYLAVRGIAYLRPAMLFTHPAASLTEDRSGGFLDPIEGTLLLATIGLVIATPLAVCTAIWSVEYGRPRWLARTVESSIEIVSGTPDIVIAIFGLAVFQLSLFAPLSFRSASGGVFGRSFIAAGAMMSLLALPQLYAATRDGLQALPRSLREASYALGKTRIATIRRVLVPGVRANIATGAALGIARIIGDTAIVILLLGGTLRIEPQGTTPGLSVLRGTGSTLTSYIFGNSPAGEGNAPGKAYAAAFVLICIVLVLNALVSRIISASERDSATGRLR